MEDRCICCGSIIPEGHGWICKSCENREKNSVRLASMKRYLLTENLLVVDRKEEEHRLIIDDETTDFLVEVKNPDGIMITDKVMFDSDNMSLIDDVARKVRVNRMQGVWNLR